MGFFSKDPAEEYEREAYKKVSQEMLNNEVETGLFAKLFSEAGGNKDKATARYIKLRAKEVASEMHGQALYAEKIARDKEAAAGYVGAGFLFLTALFAYAGWWVRSETNSLPLGIAYFVFLIPLPVLWLWIGARFSTAYTASVISSLALLIIGRTEFSMEMGQAFFLGGLVTNAVLFVSFVWVSKRITG